MGNADLEKYHKVIEMADMSMVSLLHEQNLVIEQRGSDKDVSISETQFAGTGAWVHEVSMQVYSHWQHALAGHKCTVSATLVTV